VTSCHSLFIFDADILDKLPKDDARVTYENLTFINQQLVTAGSSLLIKKELLYQVWQLLINEHDVKEVYFNKD
jgi:deoxyribodipyrimidine photo-lyase